MQELYQLILQDFLASESRALSLAMASILLYLQGCQSCLYMASQSGGICLYPTPQLDLGGYKHGGLISDDICLRYSREKNLQPSKTSSPKCAKIARLGRFVLMRCAILPSSDRFRACCNHSKKASEKWKGFLPLSVETYCIVFFCSQFMAITFR